LLAVDVKHPSVYKTNYAVLIGGTSGVLADDQSRLLNKVNPNVDIMERFFPCVLHPVAVFVNPGPYFKRPLSVSLFFCYPFYFRRIGRRC